MDLLLVLFSIVAIFAGLALIIAFRLLPFIVWHIAATLGRIEKALKNRADT